MKNGIVIEDNKAYHSDTTAISKSRLINFSKTPAYFKWVEDNPLPRSDDLLTGSAFHKLVLEPETFADEFVVSPKFDKRTKLGKEQASMFFEENESKDIITIEQLDIISAMRDSVNLNRYGSLLLKGKHEESMYFTDELTGIRCKIRPDCYKIVNDRVIITDLKSCKSASPEDFMKDIVRYGYDVQSYMYSIGVSLTLNVPLENVSFVFLCVEKTAPYLTAIYEVSQDILDRGEMLFRKYIGMYKYCLDTNNWYGYNGFTNAPQIIGLPDYLVKKGNEQTKTNN